VVVRERWFQVPVGAHQPQWACWLQQCLDVKLLGGGPDWMQHLLKLAPFNAVACHCHRCSLAASLEARLAQAVQDNDSLRLEAQARGRHGTCPLSCCSLLGL
jgi:hypothetical protein